MKKRFSQSCLTRDLFYSLENVYPVPLQLSLSQAPKSKWKLQAPILKALKHPFSSLDLLYDWITGEILLLIFFSFISLFSLTFLPLSAFTSCLPDQIYKGLFWLRQDKKHSTINSQLQFEGKRSLQLKC